MSRFDQQYEQVRKEETFGPREVGISHPDNNSFVKIADNGDVEVSVGPGCAVILHPQDGSITFVASRVRFLIGDNGAFTINDLILNTDATNYAEPTFVERSMTDHTYLYDGTTNYVAEVDDREVRDPATGRVITWDEYVEEYNKEPEWNGSYFE